MQRALLSSTVVGTYLDQMMPRSIAVYRQVLSMLAYVHSDSCSNLRDEVRQRLRILEAENAVSEVKGTSRREVH